MMRKLTNLWLIILFVFIGTSSCSVLQQATNFGKCEFRVISAEDIRLAGVDLSQVSSYGDLGFADVGIITSSVLKGNLPLTLTLNIEGKNPNPRLAALDRIEYKTYVDDLEVSKGSLDKRVEIPAFGGVTVIPVNLETNLVDLLQKDSGKTLVNFALNLVDAGNKPTRISIHIKPYVNIGGVEINYPGFYKLDYEFSSGD